MGNGPKNCDALLLLAALVSIQMARGLTEDQLGLLAAFFTVLGDDLALLALCPRPEPTPSCPAPVSTSSAPCETGASPSASTSSAPIDPGASAGQ